MISLLSANKSGKMEIAHVADIRGHDNQEIKLAFKLSAIR